MDSHNETIRKVSFAIKFEIKLEDLRCSCSSITKKWKLYHKKTKVLYVFMFNFLCELFRKTWLKKFEALHLKWSLNKHTNILCALRADKPVKYISTTGRCSLRFWFIKFITWICRFHRLILNGYIHVDIGERIY